jgi:hypothetical protein
VAAAIPEEKSSASPPSRAPSASSAATPVGWSNREYEKRPGVPPEYGQRVERSILVSSARY